MFRRDSSQPPSAEERSSRPALAISPPTAFRGPTEAHYRPMERSRQNSHAVSPSEASMSEDEVLSRSVDEGRRFDETLWQPFLDDPDAKSEDPEVGHELQKRYPWITPETKRLLRQREDGQDEMDFIAHASRGDGEFRKNARYIRSKALRDQAIEELRLAGKAFYASRRTPSPEARRPSVLSRVSSRAALGLRRMSSRGDIASSSPSSPADDRRNPFTAERRPSGTTTPLHLHPSAASGSWPIVRSRAASRNTSPMPQFRDPFSKSDRNLTE